MIPKKSVSYQGTDLGPLAQASRGEGENLRKSLARLIRRVNVLI
jgi:hypothetical protein